jgi:hypothetical protein
MSVLSITEEARAKALALVRREERLTYSRMLAYHNVGSMIGASASWVRKFVKGYEETSPSLPVGMNIITMYCRLCERIEEAAARLENHATSESAGQADQGVAEASVRNAPGAARDAAGS